MGSIRTFLEEKGIAKNATPNTPIDRKTALSIINEFRSKIDKEQGEKLLALFETESGKGSSTAPATVDAKEKLSAKQDIVEPYSPSNVTDQTPTLKVLGHIDESGKAIMNQTPIEIGVEPNTASPETPKKKATTHATKSSNTPQEKPATKEVKGESSSAKKAQQKKKILRRKPSSLKKRLRSSRKKWIIQRKKRLLPPLGK